MYKLRCAVQNYHWGCRGEESIVAELKKDDDPNFEVSKDQHYAEYWFGTHASGPSEILVGDHYELLKSFIEEHPECLGSSMGKEKLELPFLSKVLSVETALSIQAHPDKKLAEFLYKTKPELYKDDNHKPEMAYALTPFTAMCGFRRAEVIVQHLHDCTFLRELIGESECVAFETAVKEGQDTKPALRRLFTAYIEADPARAQSVIDSARRFYDAKRDLSFLERWVRRLMDTYPSDGGVFAPFLLNVVEMQPGDSIYMGADIPHAYLQGEIVESMACSNNVVRAGLTPKAIDKETLLAMLTYESGDMEVLRPERKDAHYAVVTTPAREFMLEIVEVKKGESVALPVVDVPRIVIGFSGKGRMEWSGATLAYQRGSILFQAAKNAVKIVAEEDSLLYATRERTALD